MVIGVALKYVSSKDCYDVTGRELKWRYGNQYILSDPENDPVREVQ
jgi:hypothetical protein